MPRGGRRADGRGPGRKLPWRKKGLSGGKLLFWVKTLVRIIPGQGSYSHRWHRAMAPWTRRQRLHLINLHGFDVSYPDEGELSPSLLATKEEIHGLRRVPWVTGGRQVPRTCKCGYVFVFLVDFFLGGGCCADLPTHELGKELNWLQACPPLAGAGQNSPHAGWPTARARPGQGQATSLGRLKLGTKTGRTSQDRHWRR